jgi:hypothetical protein
MACRGTSCSHEALTSVASIVAIVAVGLHVDAGDPQTHIGSPVAVRLAAAVIVTAFAGAPTRSRAGVGRP